MSESSTFGESCLQDSKTLASGHLDRMPAPSAVKMAYMGRPSSPTTAWSVQLPTQERIGERPPRRARQKLKEFGQDGTRWRQPVL